MNIRRTFMCLFWSHDAHFSFESSRLCGTCPAPLVNQSRLKDEPTLVDIEELVYDGTRGGSKEYGEVPNPGNVYSNEGLFFLTLNIS